jgi:hypothetical protein
MGAGSAGFGTVDPAPSNRYLLIPQGGFQYPWRQMVVYALHLNQAGKMVCFYTKIYHCVYPNVANVGWLQIQGVKGEVVVLYFEPLTTQNLKSSGVPEG